MSVPGIEMRFSQRYVDILRVLYVAVNADSPSSSTTLLVETLLSSRPGTNNDQARAVNKPSECRLYPLRCPSRLSSHPYSMSVSLGAHSASNLLPEKILQTHLNTTQRLLVHSPWSLLLTSSTATTERRLQ